MARQLITNARVVTADEVFLGTVEMLSGRFVRIELGATLVPGAEDFGGDYLLPGLIELHTDNLERQLEPRPGVRWPSLAALLIHDAQIASAGITTVFDAMSVGDLDPEGLRSSALQTSVEALSAARESASLRADHWLHLRCELPCDGVLETTAQLIEDPCAKLVSFMDHTPGQRQWTDLEKFRIYMQKDERWSDATLDAEITRLQALRKRNLVRNRDGVSALCRDRDIALASHDDTTQEHVEEAANIGLSICEFPTSHIAAKTAKTKGMSIIMGAPNVVRGGSHSGNVAALDLAKHNLLDALSSDYVPHSLLHAVYQLRDRAHWPLHRAVATASQKPAHMVGLYDRGEIAIGKRADYIRVRETNGVPLVAGTWRGGVRIA